MTMTGRPSDKNGCGCPGAEDDDAFEASALAVGIDVSHHNGTVDWLTVRKAGYSFAFLKATEGSTYTDPTFAGNRERAAAAGLYVGAYHFFRPKTSAVDQARAFVRVVGTLKHGELPPVLDIEDESLWKGIDSKQAVDMVLTWLKEVRSALGVAPIVYCSPSFVIDVLAGNPALREFLLWLAHYTTEQTTAVPAPWTRWTFWQHSEHGRVPGVTTDCDMNRYNGTEAQLGGLVRLSTELRPLTTIVHHFWLRLLMRFGL